MTIFPSVTRSPSDIFSGIAMLLVERPFQKSYVKLDNFTLFGLANDGYSIMTTRFGSKTDFTMINSNFYNISSNVPIFELGSSNTKYINNISIRNWTFTNTLAIEMTDTETSEISNISIEDIKVTDSFSNHLLTMTASSGGSLSLSNITISNCDISDSKSILYLSSTAGSLIGNNIVFRDMILTDEVSALRMDVFTSAVVTNLSYSNITQSSENDISNTLLNLETISSTANSNLTFNGVSVEDSTVALLKISNSGQSKTINQYVTVNNLVYQN